MAQRRKATRNAAGGELSEKQVEAEFARIRDGSQRIKRAETLRAIKRYYEADEIEVTSKKISLICPISKARVTVPVRSVNCRHMACFDLRSYLNYHRQLTFWECPFSCCKAQARCDSLRVDEYMSDVLRAIDDDVQEVEISADGSFKAVQHPTPTKEEPEIIDDEDPYIPDSDKEPIIKAEVNNDDEPVETAVSLAEEGQPQAYPLAAGGKEQSLEALHQSRQQNACVRQLRCELGSANIRPEPNASKLRDENHRHCEEPAATAQDTRGLTTKNQEQYARLDLVPRAAEAIQQMDHEPIEPVSFSMDHDPHESSPSLAAGDAAQATTDNGASVQGHPLPEHTAGASSDASISLLDLPGATSMESDSDLEEQPRHAPKQRNMTRKNHFACVECARVFNKRNELRRHQRTHSGEKPYKCGQCDKAFAENGNLRTHERIHTGEKPFQCAQCGRTFAAAGNLCRHERVHTGVKPYKCGRCGEAFAHSGSLRTHARIHSGEKPYKCVHCGKAFAQSSSLRTHERIHSGEKPYKCAQCGKAFTQASNFRRHERTSHPAAEPSKKAKKTAAQARSQSEA